MIFLILLVANGLPLFLLKTSKKYWIVAIPVWILLLGILAVERIRDDRTYNIAEKHYYSTFGNKNYGDDVAWKTLEKAGAAAGADSRKAFVGVGFQTLCVFVLMIIGYRRTKDKWYKWGKWFFGFCSLLVVLINLLLAAAAAGPFI